MDDEFETGSLSTGSSSLIFPIASAVVAFALGLLAGGFGLYLVSAPEQVMVEVPRDLNAEELAEACGPLIAEAATNLEEAKAKVQTLEDRVKDKERQVSEMELSLIHI